MKKYLLIIFIILLITSLQAKSKWTGKDKYMHFTGSAFLTYWNYGVSSDIMELSSDKSIYFAVSVSLALGTVKEYSDKKLKKTEIVMLEQIEKPGFSWHDLIYDTAGILTGIILINNLRL